MEDGSQPFFGADICKIFMEQSELIATHPSGIYLLIYPGIEMQFFLLVCCCATAGCMFVYLINLNLINLINLYSALLAFISNLNTNCPPG